MYKVEKIHNDYEPINYKKYNQNKMQMQIEYCSIRNNVL